VPGWDHPQRDIDVERIKGLWAWAHDQKIHHTITLEDALEQFKAIQKTLEKN